MQTSPVLLCSPSNPRQRRLLRSSAAPRERPSSPLDNLTNKTWLLLLAPYSSRLAYSLCSSARLLDRWSKSQFKHTSKYYCTTRGKPRPARTTPVRTRVRTTVAYSHLQVCPVHRRGRAVSPTSSRRQPSPQRRQRAVVLLLSLSPVTPRFNSEGCRGEYRNSGPTAVVRTRSEEKRKQGESRGGETGLISATLQINKPSSPI